MQLNKSCFLLVIAFWTLQTFAQEQPIDRTIPQPTPIVSTAQGNVQASGTLATFTEYDISGKVISVYDGDTATILTDGNLQVKVRFNGIDAPEAKQDFGNRSKQNLSRMIAGKNVTAHCPKIDKYGRSVCTVFDGETDINLEQIKGGFAWHYKKYAVEQNESDREIYAEAENAAREQKLGLWSQKNPTPPWDWRNGENNPNTEGVPSGSIIGNRNSMIYHTPGCSTYAKVSPQNQVIFATEQKAVESGYRIAGGCKSTIPPR